MTLVVLFMSQCLDVFTLISYLTRSCFSWIQQWDANSQRYFYVEQATGRTQWEPPAFSPPPGGAFSPPPAPYGAPGYGPPGHGAPGYGAPGYGAPGYGHEGDRGHGGGYGYDAHGSGDGYKGDKEKKKDKDKSNTGKLVAAGAVGAIGGAVIASQLGMSLQRSLATLS
jgi:hypothetical protein